MQFSFQIHPNLYLYSGHNQILHPVFLLIHVSLTSETQCEWLREKFCDGYEIVYKALAATPKNFFFIKKESKSAATSRVQNFGSIALSCQGSSISSRSRVLISKETALFGINLSHRSSVPKWSDKLVFNDAKENEKSDLIYTTRWMNKSLL